MKARDEGVLGLVQQIPITLAQPRERRAEVLQVIERPGMKHGRSVVRRSTHRPSRARVTPILYTLRRKDGPRAAVVSRPEVILRSAALAILITAWIAAVAAAKEPTAAEETVVVTS